MHGRGHATRRDEVGVRDEHALFRFVYQVEVGLIDEGLLEPGAALKEPGPGRLELELHRRLQDRRYQVLLLLLGPMRDLQLDDLRDRRTGEPPSVVRVERRGSAVLDLLEEVVVPIEGLHDIADDRAAQRHVLVSPSHDRLGGDSEVLIRDVEAANDGDGVRGHFAVDDPHLVVEALVGAERILRLDLRGGGLHVQRLIAFDFNAVLLEIEVHPLGLEVQVGDSVDDHAHVEPLLPLLLEQLCDAQSGFVRAKNQGLHPHGLLRLFERGDTCSEGVLSGTDERDLGAPPHGEYPRTLHVLQRTAGELEGVGQDRRPPFIRIVNGLGRRARHRRWCRLVLAGGCQGRRNNRENQRKNDFVSPHGRRLSDGRRRASSRTARCAGQSIAEVGLSIGRYRTVTFRRFARLSKAM